jgi:hypothetical protein
MLGRLQLFEPTLSSDLSCRRRANCASMINGSAASRTNRPAPANAPGVIVNALRFLRPRDPVVRIGETLIHHPLPAGVEGV